MIESLILAAVLYCPVITVPFQTWATPLQGEGLTVTPIPNSCVEVIDEEGVSRTDCQVKLCAEVAS